MPNTPSRLEELARTCEAAEGPDREIDRDIGLAMNVYDRPEDLGCFSDPAEAVVSGGGQTFAAPAYTASLDAALLLVPEGYDRLCDNTGRCEVVELFSREQHITPIWRGSHPTSFALALCAAALRAQAIRGLLPPLAPPGPR